MDTRGNDPPSAASQPPARLLVVDDDPLSSSLLAHFAQLLGYAATAESDPQRAIEKALGGGFDAMLLDLGMPQIDGFEVLRRLREREAALQRPPVPVIAVTGYASDTDRLRCLMAGFTEHLTKPVQVSALGASIARALATQEAGRTGAPPRDCDAERLRSTVRRLGHVKPADGRFAPTITESFALRSAQLIESLRAAVDGGDREAGKRAAHALRASAEFLGALRLAGMCGELGAALDTPTAAARETARVLLEEIEHEHQAVLTVLFESSP